MAVQDQLMCGAALLLFVAVHCATASANCYSCTWTTGQPDICMDADLSQMATVACPDGSVCVAQNLYRIQHGGTWTFYRGCVEEGHPFSVEGCTLGAEDNTCQTVCTTELCNTGNGVPQGCTLTPPYPAGGPCSSSGNPSDDDGNMASSRLASVFVILLGIFMIVIFHL